MANPLFNELNGNLQNGVYTNPTPSFQEQFQEFAKNFMANGGVNPQTMVQQLINSGRMSREQFEQYSQIANMITGKQRY